MVFAAKEAKDEETMIQPYAFRLPSDTGILFATFLRSI
jgi:hypothetical protein